jgi:DMSO/TMAO reductase YedYZ molybdopterin-dependent catalytic subunit
VLLAWAEEGAPLSANEGPLRLVVPGDLRGGRYIYGIVSIDVRSIDDAAS